MARSGHFFDAGANLYSFCNFRSYFKWKNGRKNCDGHSRCKYRLKKFPSDYYYQRYDEILLIQLDFAQFELDAKVCRSMDSHSMQKAINWQYTERRRLRARLSRQPQSLCSRTHSLHTLALCPSPLLWRTNEIIFWRWEKIDAPSNRALERLCGCFGVRSRPSHSTYA